MSSEGRPANTKSRRSLVDRLLRTFSSIRTGIILLILVGIASAAGTLILQRPLTDPEKLQRAYSPETLRWLDALGLTDVFHAWWFVALLSLLSVNLILASLERLPLAWRYFSRPYRQPDSHFVKSLPLHREIPIRSETGGAEAAERAFRRMGFKPQRVAKNGSFSLYAERHRFARLAAYVVHASLLLIFAGGIADALWGYRGFIGLTRGEQGNQIELRDGTFKTLPFSIRCEAAGQENYPDGSPRRWWSQLTVLEEGREVKRKEIEVNDPLVHRGLRFFQSSYGSTGQVDAIRLTARPKNSAEGQTGAAGREIVLTRQETVALDPDTSVHLAAFVPDFVIVGNRIDSRSDQPNNPAIQLEVHSKKGDTRVWLFPRFPNFTHPDESPYAFQFGGLEMGYFTGLQVAYEPGQWAVWAGVILMGLGLIMAFYFVHVRVWAVPLNDGRGRLVLWLGASASKNRDEFEERFGRLAAEIEKELKATPKEWSSLAEPLHPSEPDAQALPLARQRG